MKFPTTLRTALVLYSLFALPSLVAQPLLDFSEDELLEVTPPPQSSDSGLFFSHPTEFKAFPKANLRAKAPAAKKIIREKISQDLTKIPRKKFKPGSRKATVEILSESDDSSLDEPRIIRKSSRLEPVVDGVGLLKQKQIRTVKEEEGVEEEGEEEEEIARMNSGKLNVKKCKSSKNDYLELKSVTGSPFPLSVSSPLYLEIQGNFPKGLPKGAKLVVETNFLAFSKTVTMDICEELENNQSNRAKCPLAAGNHTIFFTVPNAEFRPYTFKMQARAKDEKNNELFCLNALLTFSF